MSWGSKKADFLNIYQTLASNDFKEILVVQN